MSMHDGKGPMPGEHEQPRRRRPRKRRLSMFEIFVMIVGYATILYAIVRGLTYVAVLLAR